MEDRMNFSIGTSKFGTTLMSGVLGLAMLGYALPANAAAIVEFETFQIRNNNGTIDAPFDADLTIVENAAGNGFNAETPRSGQKVGYGTNAFDGMQLNSFNTVNWDQVGNPPGAVPYLNFWVTDGTNYAVIARGGAYKGTDFQTLGGWLVYENSVGFDWLLGAGLDEVLTGNPGNLHRLEIDTGTGTIDATLADFADDIVLFQGPGVGALGVGTGAPQGGFGFNVIYGDTQANYVGGFDIENLTIRAGGEDFAAGNDIPEPASLALFGLGLIGVGAMRRKKKLAITA